MKIRVAMVCALGLSTLALAGCSSNPLVGRWTVTNSAGGVETTVTMNLTGGGSVDVTVAGMGACSGTLTFTGGTWTSTSTQLMFAGTPACSGMVTCMVAGTSVNIDCAMAQNFNTSGTQNYTLSNNNMTLTVGMSAFTRAN